MGLNHTIVKLLMREGKREEYAGNILTIGRQGSGVKTTRELQKFAKEMKFQLNSNITISIPSGKNQNNDYHITDNVLFLSLGFDNIDSLDISDYEQCTIIHDLNIDVPAKLYNKYDLIFDGGSSEHIFNLPKVLENYNKMLKVGGRLIHTLPSSNYIDHGFYMFSPTLFWDYYLSNNWEIKDSLFLRRPSSATDEALWDIYNYTPGCLDRIVRFDGCSKGLYGIFFVIKKSDESTYNASVQQGSYLKAWKGASNPENIKAKDNYSLKKKVYLFIPKRLKPISLHLYIYCIGIVREINNYISRKIPIRFYLKVIGRY